MRPIQRWILQCTQLWLLLAAASTACAQHFPILQVPNSPHGIFSMMQDSESALWLGTIDDVYRFDGTNFYSLRQYGFPKEIPNGFAEDSDGGIWIATQGSDTGGGTGKGGIYRYRAGHVEKIFSGDGLSVVTVAPGILLASIGTELQGKPAYGDLILFRKEGNRWNPTRLLDKQADHITIDHRGNALFPCPGGWCEIARESLLHIPNAGTSLNVDRHVANPMLERVLRDKFGCMWFRAESFASYQCKTDPQPTTLPESISEFDSSAHLEETAKGDIFMLVRLALGRPGAFQTAIDADGLPPAMGTAIVGKDGTIWIGADGGLYRFMYPFRLTLWDKNDGISSIFGILRTSQSTYISGEGIRRLDSDGRHWTDVAPRAETAGYLTPGPNGTLFLATASDLYDLDANGKVLAQTAISRPDTFFKLASGPDGQAWLGHRGVSSVIMKDGRPTLHSELTSEKETWDIKYDVQRHTLWACDGNDVVYQKNGTWGRISQRDGLLNFPCRALAIGNNGDLWLSYGASTDPAWIRDPTSGAPKIVNNTQRINELIANGTDSFLEVDHGGWIWRSSDAMYVASPDAAKADAWLRLDENDGFSIPGTDKQPFAADSDGSVWLTTATGVAHFTPPENFATVFPTPQIFVGGFSFGQATATTTDAVNELPRNTELVVHVGSLQFDRRSNLHLRYRLLPNQSSWIESNTFDLHLGKLGWGTHHLQIQGQLLNGPWSPVIEQPLTVPWPVWLSWPVLLLYGAGGTGMSFGAAQWSKRRRRQRELSLPDLSAWRMSALSPEAEQLVGTRIDDRYEVSNILSVGGFATVVKARDLENESRPCAVKIFRYEFGDRAWIRHRFEQEIWALEQLSHPNIVRITGHGAIGTGAPYLVMEFIQGQSLRERLDQGAVPRNQIGVFLRQIAGALQSLHQRAIYHRDLKPENLMIRSDAEGMPEIILIDFSIAIVKSRDQTFHGISRVAGTLEYMAPEQVIGYVDASTDIYSLAKVVMEMVTGMRWAELFPEATLDLPEQIRDYFAENAGIFKPDSIDAIVWAMAFDPARRPKEVIKFAEPIVRDLEQRP
jgi:tRNA A-37 threonylcarbamoyl transferase component Bud32